MSHSVFWGGGDERPMIVSDGNGHEIVIPYDDAIGVAQQIASHMGESLQEVTHRFTAGDHLQVDAGLYLILEDYYPPLDAG